MISVFFLCYYKISYLSPFKGPQKTLTTIKQKLRQTYLKLNIIDHQKETGMVNALSKSESEKPKKREDQQQLINLVFQIKEKRMLFKLKPPNTKRINMSFSNNLGGKEIQFKMNFNV